MKFVKKPVVIEAMQLTKENFNAMCEFAGTGNLSEGKPELCRVDKDGKILPSGIMCSGDLGLQIPTLEGVMLASPGDWIIKGIKGEIYPCKPDIFEATYSKVDGPSKEDIAMELITLAMEFNMALGDKLKEGITTEEIKRLKENYFVVDKKAQEYWAKVKGEIQCPTCKKNIGHSCGIENLKWGRAMDCSEYEKI